MFYYNPTLVFHGTILALHEKPEFLTLNKSKIRTLIQGNNCAMKNQSWMPIIFDFIKKVLDAFNSFFHL